MAAALRDKVGIDPELIEGSGGVFDVKLNGDLVFSKKIAGRFPEEAEIIDAVSA